MNHDNDSDIDDAASIGSDIGSSGSDDASSSSLSYDEIFIGEEEELEDVIPDPQDEDGREDNRIFRKWRWRRSAYNYIMGSRSLLWPFSILKSSRDKVPFNIPSGSGEKAWKLDIDKLSTKWRNSIMGNEEVCSRIGRRYAKIEGIKYLHVTLSSLEREGIRGFFRNWVGELSHLKGLHLQSQNFGDNGTLGAVGAREILDRFLHKNTVLSELHLTETALSLDNARELAYIFSNESPSLSLVHLGLARNNLGDVGVSLISRAVCNMPTIESVNLRETGIEHYSSIAPLIRSSASLVMLELGNYVYDRPGINRINDEFISDMVADLSGNNHITKINLEKLQIKELGWASMMELIINDSSFGSLIASNHQLNSLGRIHRDRGFRETSREVISKLMRALCTNQSKLSQMDKARQKIMEGYFWQARLSLIELDIKIMPYILSMVGAEQKYHSWTQRQRLKTMHWLVSHSPSLFEYPSPEKERLLEVMEEKLREKDRIIFELKRELDELRQGRANSDSCFSKRPRVD